MAVNILATDPATGDLTQETAADGRASQAVVEYLLVESDIANARASQIVIEYLLERVPANARASQVVIEYLIILQPPGPGPGPAPGPEETLLIFPATKGLGWNYIKRPKWSTNIGSHVSGREMRILLWQNPLWEWEVTFDFLPDDKTAAHPGTTLSDLQEIMGFFGAVSGSGVTFLFQDPDDNYVFAQPLGTGDGNTPSTYTFVRSFGSISMGGPWGTGGAFTEPVGQVNLGVPMHLYVNGSLIDPSTYTISQTPLLGNTVTFTDGVALGLPVTADFGYYFATRFKDDTLDFEKFAYKLWEQHKLVLVSTRD